MRAGCHDLDIPCVPARRAVLTRPIGNRAACFYATSCGRGCSIGAAFQTTTSLLPMALATGNLTIVTDAMVYEVRLDKKGKAEGVNYIDRNTGKHEAASGRTVVLAASAGETARIMLNSKSNSFPDGAARVDSPQTCSSLRQCSGYSCFIRGVATRDRVQSSSLCSICLLGFPAPCRHICMPGSARRSRREAAVGLSSDRWRES